MRKQSLSSVPWLDTPVQTCLSPKASLFQTSQDETSLVAVARIWADGRGAVQCSHLRDAPRMMCLCLCERVMWGVGDLSRAIEPLERLH